VAVTAEADLALLCRSCGLCCDGSLFGRADLEPSEVEPARRRLHVLSSGKGFEQPCTALASSGPERGERICSIYDERPRSCRRFVCRLYERHRREGGPIEPRLAVVRRVRRLIDSLPADSRAARATPSVLELTRILEEDFARA
jgi:hypothetical protein